MEVIYKRRSIRKYTDREVTDEELKELLRAGTAAPSAGNQQPWEFIIVRDKKIFEKITQIHPHSQMLKQASSGIVVCADLDKERHKGYWPQDCAAATQNILLAAASKGIGAVWLGIYPREDRVKGLKELFSLPESIMPLCVISVGYPAEEKDEVDRFDEKRIHWEGW